MLALLFVLVPEFASAGVLTFCYESADVRPWRLANREGLNFDLIRAAAKRTGEQVSFVELPWKRCLAELQSNAVDGAFAASFKPDRLDFGRYPGGATPDIGKRLHMDTYVVVRRKGDGLGWNGSAFTGLTGPVGIQLGYSVGDQLKSMGVAIDDGSLMAAELLQKLSAGRVGAAAMLGGEIAYLLKSDARFRDRLEVLPLPLVEKPYYLMLSRRLAETEPVRARALWQAIESVRTSRDYQQAEASALRELSR